MVIENLQTAPLPEWLLGPKWQEGSLWQPTGIVLLLVVVGGGGLLALLGLRRRSAALGPTASLLLGGAFGVVSLALLGAVAMCSTETTRSWLTAHITGPASAACSQWLGPDWSGGALYTWLTVIIGLAGVIYVCCWLVAVLSNGPLEGTRQCGRGVIDIASDVARTSPRRVLALAWLAIRESFRHRALVVFAVFVVLILFAALFMGNTSLHPAQLYIQVVMNFTIYLSMLFALILSTLSLPADIRDRTLHTVVTKPVRKLEIVLGRVLGFVFVGTVLLAAFGLISYGFTVRGLDHRHELTRKMWRSDEELPGHRGVLKHYTTRPAHGHAHEVTIHVFPDHTHQLTAEMLHSETLENGRVVLRGMTSESLDHKHEVTVDPSSGDVVVEIQNGHTHAVQVQGRGATAVYTVGPPLPNATVEKQKDHTHDLTMSGSLSLSGSGGTATFTLGPPKGDLQALVPIYGSLAFLDRAGTPQEKGINVGDEWTYRSFIEGGTHATAIWTFSGLRWDLFPEAADSAGGERMRDGIPLEMTIEVFRTHKGDQEKGVAGNITLVNPERKDIRASLPTFLAKKFATDVHRIPRQFITTGSDGKAATIHLFPCFEVTAASLESLRAGKVPEAVLSKLGPLKNRVFESRERFWGELSAVLTGVELQSYREQILSGASQPGLVSDNGRLEVHVQCLERQQYYGMAQADLYIRAADNSFIWNFFKGYLGIWLQMVLVICVGVMCSTFLSGPIALLLTLFMIVAGIFSGYIGELASGKMVGGGPFESAERIMTQDNMISELEPGIKTDTIKAMDKATAVMMRYFSALVPNVSENDFPDHVACGFDVGPVLLTRCFLWEAAYLLPVIFLGYMALKQREVAQ